MKQTIEFLSDKSYVWMVGPFKHEGTYELKSSTLFLTRKGVKLKPLSWENLTLKDGKIIHPVAENFYHEWAPIKP